jgi:hypothetical protein
VPPKSKVSFEEVMGCELPNGGTQVKDNVCLWISGSLLEVSVLSFVLRKHGVLMFGGLGVCFIGEQRYRRRNSGESCMTIVAIVMGMTHESYVFLLIETSPLILV